MGTDSISVIRLRDVLLLTVPADPDDETISAIQSQLLDAMERYEPKGVILDLSTVETLDSFFARTVSETVRMVALMGARSVLVGLRPCVAVTVTQLGLTLDGVETSLDMERALGRFSAFGMQTEH